jgi:hypothetical protein
LNFQVTIEECTLSQQNFEEKKSVHIKILTSCTGEKLFSPENQLTQDDFWQLNEQDIFSKREEQLNQQRTEAEKLYTGLQHLRLMDGIQLLRNVFGGDAVSLSILSAGYGVIPGNRMIVPYECTFQTMKNPQIDKWATHLQIPEQARAFFTQDADLTLVLLGESYLRALQLDNNVLFASPTLFLASENSKKYIQGQGAIRVVTLSNQEAKRFSCGLVGLKGEIASRLVKNLSKAENVFQWITTLFEESTDILSQLDAHAAPVKKSSPNGSLKPEPTSNVDWIVQLSETWKEKPHRNQLRYFIPEWDDRVDNDYDFENDIHSGGTGGWHNEVYAHQMYDAPNYDGILVSKVVSEKSKSKKEQINQIGVHRYLRVPEDFPVMGDCGAFGYIKEETPPYTTDEILDYYTRIGFNYGVSIDHLIVTATERQKQFRYDLTIHNAENFIREHKQQALTWTPIGAVQGWDPASYREAARQYVAMGYKYIALGGLVRTTTQEILQILHEVHQVVPDDVAIHLFGIARLNGLSEFVKLGVKSIDSASALRRAWLGSKDNYWTLDGGRYAAIRIPEAGKSFRAKRIVAEERASAGDVEQLAHASLQAVRDYDRGKISVTETLDILDEFDHLITPDRESMRADYQYTLEAQPWKSCPCDICRRDGVEVIIFRGNNRNRRRGFHNTYVFYQLLQQMLLGEAKNTTQYQLPLF